MSRKKHKKTFLGVSLIELLVVIAIFSILAVLSARGIFLSLRGARKSESVTKVRENLDYSFAVMERRLRGAEDVSCSEPQRVDYTSPVSGASYFSCELTSNDGYISSASARLTNDEVLITQCEFVCSAQTGGTPASVDINVTGVEKSVEKVEGAEVNLSTKVFLRTY